MGGGLKYEPSLDGLRAIAVIAVLAYHAHAPFAVGGQRGVDLFFVLSGFLITSILARGDLRFGEFWRRRAVRLVPALFVMVVVTAILAPWLIPRQAAMVWRDAAYAVTYTMNVALAAKPWPNVFIHTWSLAAEVQFYLLWPFILPMLLRLRPAVSLLLLWVASTVLTMAIDAYAAAPFTSYYFPHFSGLFLGAALAFLPAANRWLGLLGFSVVLAGMGSLLVPNAAVEAGAALLIASLRNPSALRSLLSWPPLVWVGTISYGVYLWHIPVISMFPGMAWLPRGAIGLVGGLALAAISHAYIERPLIRAAASARPSPAQA
jgi:peptidoglycan/LPS O-acetylase OafA/YrhL